MADRSFPKTVRVLRQADFDRVYHGKVYAADGVLVLNAAPNGLSVIRLGLSVSKKVGNAVVRNRWKRLIREAFRLQREEMPVGIDIVLRPKLGAVPEFAAVVRSLPELVRRVARKLPKRPPPCPG